MHCSLGRYSEACVITQNCGACLLTKPTACLRLKARIELSIGIVYSQVITKNVTVILVHGAGSYGHLIAKKYCLSQGRVASIPESDQKAGVDTVHRDLRTLSEIIIAELGKQGIKCKLHSPRTWATGTGPTFIGDLSRFTAMPDSAPIVHMTHGDIVACAKPKMFGVLSGDDLMLRLARHVFESPTHRLRSVIFAMDVGGLLSAPPGRRGRRWRAVYLVIGVE